MCRLRVGLSGWFKWVLCAYTLSPHLVPTPCLHTLSLRFVASCLCWRTRRSGATRMAQRSRAESGALSRPRPRPRSRPRPRARYCRYCRSCRDCRWLPPHIHYPAVLQAGTGSRCGFVLRWRAFAGTAPVWRGHSCLRGVARAGRNARPTLPRSIAAASRDGVAPPALARFCWNFPCTRPQPTPIDPSRPPSRLATNALAARCHCLPPPHPFLPS